MVIVGICTRGQVEIIQNLRYNTGVRILDLLASAEFKSSRNRVCTLCYSFYDEHIDGCGINFCSALGNNFVIVGPLTKFYDVSVLTGIVGVLVQGFWL
ncbi:hypothetical protein ACFX14_013615 [Malus domestica]